MLGKNIGIAIGIAIEIEIENNYITIVFDPENTFEKHQSLKL
jgi:hypothetical protein